MVIAYVDTGASFPSAPLEHIFLLYLFFSFIYVISGRHCGCWNNTHSNRMHLEHKERGESFVDIVDQGLFFDWMKWQKNYFWMKTIENYETCNSCVSSSPSYFFYCSFSLGFSSYEGIVIVIVLFHCVSFYWTHSISQTPINIFIAIEHII